MGNRLWTIVVGTALIVALGACGGGKLDEGDDRAEAPPKLPDNHPPVASGPAGSALGSSAPTDEHELPLKLEGLNSLAELERAREGTDNDEARAAFVSGYRKTFSADASKRDYNGAVADLNRAIELDPGYAEAYRALGYAEFNATGMNVAGAMPNYRKAVELKPEYGEAHYALAFLYTLSDREAGARHFWKAMELGVPDERNLGERFYSGDPPAPN